MPNQINSNPESNGFEDFVGSKVQFTRDYTE